MSTIDSLDLTKTRRATDREFRVVMADDDPNDHLLMTMAVQESGIPAEFVFVSDGQKLLLHLDRITSMADLPNLIVLDLRMPGLNGHRTLDELQSHPVLWQIPVVIFTSTTRPIDEATSYERGARHFKTKPSHFADLVAFTQTLSELARFTPYSAPGAEGEVFGDSLLSRFDDGHDAFGDHNDFAGDIFNQWNER